MSIQFIDEQKQLLSILPKLNKANQLAIDLEFDKNYYRYGFNLCLMQLFDGKTCYLIDPLSGSLEINTIFPVLENPSIQKVTFAFGEDLRLLHSMDCFPKNIYDLDIAISLLNYSPASLTNHLADILDIDTGKSSQLSNWYKRPLTTEQIQYAAEDVLHLLKLQKTLSDEAEHKNIIHWIDEENSAFDDMDFSKIDNNDFIKEKDKNDFTEKEWHIYVHLMVLREEIAEKINKPSFQIIKKEVLKKIAQDPGKLDRWTSTRGIYKRLRTDDMKNKLNEIVEIAIQEADRIGLSDQTSAVTSLTDEERNHFREQRQKINRAKAEFFNPIKNKIEGEYGKEVSTFLFSNRIIAEIITENNTDLSTYKLSLLQRYSAELNLILEDYITV